MWSRARIPLSFEVRSNSLRPDFHDFGRFWPFFEFSFKKKGPYSPPIVSKSSGNLVGMIRKVYTEFQVPDSKTRPVIYVQPFRNAENGVFLRDFVFVLGGKT